VSIVREPGLPEHVTGLDAFVRRTQRSGAAVHRERTADVHRAHRCELESVARVCDGWLRKLAERPAPPPLEEVEPSCDATRDRDGVRSEHGHRLGARTIPDRFDRGRGR
jgi:hypothetical protein